MGTPSDFAQETKSSETNMSPTTTPSDFKQTDTDLNMIQALNHSLDWGLQHYANTVILGEDVGYFGGVFRVTQGLQKKYGVKRVFDTPLSECGIIGTSIGMALGGLHPIAEIQFADFVFPAMDQIASELSKYRYRSGGQYSLNMMIRMPYGGGIKGGHYHSQSPEAFFTHLPGLRVVVPSGPYEAKGLMLAALESKDPVIFLEPKRIYRSIKASVPKNYYTLPLDKALVKRPGHDLTLIAYGAMIDVVMKAAELAQDEGYECEVIDMLTLLPFDKHTLCESVKKTGRGIIVHEAPKTCGYGAELVASIQESVFSRLQAPLTRVTGFDTPFPYRLEHHYLPSPERILDCIRTVMSY